MQKKYLILILIQILFILIIFFGFFNYIVIYLNTFYYNFIDLLLNLLPQEQTFSYFDFIYNKLLFIKKFLSLKSLSSSYLIFINDKLINLITNNNLNINIFICYIFIKILLKIKIIIIILTKIFIINTNKLLFQIINLYLEFIIIY